ncbi:MAG: HEAT repeat domain-containing protein, partial [Phycisphaerales bacterium]
NRTTARILHGGTLTEPFEMILTLDAPSHARARAIQNAINDAFPRGPLDRVEVAKGRNDEAIAITIPDRYREDAGKFVRLLLSTRIDRAFPNEWAARYIRAMREEPALADDLSWCLQALGPTVIPQLRDLYDYAEPKPRLSALRAGAELGDALDTPHLTEIAKGQDSIQRLQAIRLLANMPPNPRLNQALRELVDADDIAVRIAAYEALAARADPSLVVSRSVGIERTLYTRPDDPGEFRLDVIRSNKPMIYISQQGEPRIVVFGESLTVDRPTLVYAWDDRLMLVGDDEDEPLRVRYQDWRLGSTAVQSEADPNVGKLIEFFAHKPTPEAPAPGLAMSYSEVVGALYALTQQTDAIPADFVAEQDKLQAELLALVQTEIGSERPELAGEGAEVPETAAIDALTGDAPSRAEPASGPGRSPFVVPIAPKEPVKKNTDGGGE